MSSQDFGLWAMLIFWTSAIGGIFIAIKWANRRSRKSPVPKEVMLLSLKKRLEADEISQDEYDKRCNNL